MFFLLNDVVLSLDLQLMTPPMIARRFSALTLEGVRSLGRELYAEDPRLQHHRVERGRRLACLIVSKAPEVNAALFVAPSRDCHPDRVAVRMASLDIQLLAELQREQQSGRLNAAICDTLVWGRPAA
jgi:hypothetical protein